MNIGSFDSGGTCGIIQARFLSNMGYTVEGYDLLAGTSTGAITAVALALGLKPGDIENFYYLHAPQIFRRSFFHRVTNPWAIFGGALYKIEDLASILHKLFGSRKLSSLNTKVMVLAYDRSRMRPKVFKSWEDKDVEAWSVVTASCAAPVYFTDWLGYIDGAFVEPNPAFSAVADALKIGTKLEEIYLDSFGGGEHLKAPSTLISELLAGSVSATHYECLQLPLKGYRRFNVKLPENLAAMDDTSQDTLRARCDLVDAQFV